MAQASRLRQEADRTPPYQKKRGVLREKESGPSAGDENGGIVARPSV